MCLALNPWVMDINEPKDPKGCHPERSRRTSPTWVTCAAFERSLDYARDDIAMLWSDYLAVGGNWPERRSTLNKYPSTILRKSYAQGSSSDFNERLGRFILPTR